jgi:CHAT domain-containing protein
MLRMLIFALLGLSLIAVAFADEPKPQWQRMLTGDDAKKAADLQKQVADADAADRFAEAIALQEELLALRTKVQGADHWETVATKWQLTGIKKVAALPEKKLASWRKAEKGLEEATRLEQTAQYANALPLRQEHVKMCLQVLGEEHIYTAMNYSNVADNLHAQSKYADAGQLYLKALDIFRRAWGEDNPGIGKIYLSAALNLNDGGKYAEAELLLQKALDIFRRVRGEEHQQTAACYDALASILSEQGKYAEAGRLYQKGLDIHRSIFGEDHLFTAGCYSHVGVNLDAQRKHAEARPLLQRALDTRRKLLGENHEGTGRSYSNLAVNLDHLGKFAEAALLYRKALEIFQKVHGEEHPVTALGYNNVAFHLGAQRRYAEAARQSQRALDIRRKVLGKEHPDTAASLHNLAANLELQGKYAAAGPLFQEALQVLCKVRGQEHPNTVLAYYNVAFSLHGQRKYAEALETLEAAARAYEGARQDVAARGLERAAFGHHESPYEFLAAARARAGRSADAWEALESDLARGLLDEMAFRRTSGLTPAEQRRRDELKSQRTPINHSILALVSQPKRTDEEAAELERLIEQRRELEKSLIELAVAASRKEVATLPQIRAALPAAGAFVAWVDVADRSLGVQEHWCCIVRGNGNPIWERLPGSGGDEKWTTDEVDLRLQFREALAKSASAPEIEALAKKLYAQRIAPLSKHLAGVKQLFVAPVDQMVVEALTDEYTVSYTPSGTFLARLKNRDRPRTNDVLAVGDPVFPPAKEAPQQTSLPPGGLLIMHVVPGSNAAKARLQNGDVLVAYAGEDLTSLEQLDKLLAANINAKSVVVKVWRDGQEKMAEREVAPDRLGVLLAKEPAREAITARRQTEEMLAKLLRGEDFAELPGTQVEITRLAGLFDAKNVFTLTRADASEQRLEEMRKADKLRRFKYLHFATHGKANNFRSFDSALILTPPEKVPEPRAGEPWLDGRLTAAEVLEYWKLDAELVTLSACESALGQHGGGDGLLGFAQAFLLAGSRSVCLTLWQVDDTATALLMDRFYRNLLGKREDKAKPMGKAAALHEAKQWLRNLSAKDAEEWLGTLTKGIVRGERPAREIMRKVPLPEDAGKDYKPYAHPRYWAAFILIGDPE